MSGATEASGRMTSSSRSRTKIVSATLTSQWHIGQGCICMARIRAFVVANLWWLVLTVSLAMLVAHSLGVKRLVVDHTSLGLLAVVLISPCLAAITNVRIRDF